MTIEKFASNRATVECRYNPKQKRYRCHVAAGRKRVGPIFVRLPGGEGEAADAARIAIERAIKNGGISAADAEHADGEVSVHAERAKRRTPMRAKAPVAAKVKAKAKRALSAKAVAKALKITGNGEQTKALEREYRAARKQYHAVGEALRERHEAVAAVAAGG